MGLQKLGMVVMADEYQDHPKKFTEQQRFPTTEPVNFPKKDKVF